MKVSVLNIPYGWPTRAYGAAKVPQEMTSLERTKLAIRLRQAQFDGENGKPLIEYARTIGLGEDIAGMCRELWKENGS